MIVSGGEVVAVDVVLRVVVGAVLVAHGLVHLLYLAPDVSQFSLDRSWLVPESGRRPVAYTLMGATIVAFVLVALGVWQIPLTWLTGRELAGSQGCDLR